MTTNEPEARWRPWLSRLAVGLLAAAALVMLVEPVWTLGDPISRNYNEGWNGLHVQRLLDGDSLYPPADAFFVNNYPPLSFAVVAGLTWISGDPIVAGRVLSLLALFAVAVCAAQIARSIADCRGIGVLAGVLVLFVFTLHFRHYVAMNDPQLFGHALQWSALALLLRARSRPRAAAVLLVAGGLVKHNLVAVPVVAVVWLTWRRRDHLREFLVAAGIAVGVGCAWLLAVWGSMVFTAVLGHARTFDAARLTGVLRSWFGPLALVGVAAALASLRRVRDPRVDALTLVAVLGLGSGLVFSLGGGISYNVIFDGTIALCALAALGVHAVFPTANATIARDGLRAVTIVACGAFVAVTGPGSPLEGLRRLEARDERLAEFERDRAFVADRGRPLLTGTLALALAAGKGFDVDLFNVHEAIASGAMDPDRLARRVRSREFQVIQLSAYDREHRVGAALMQVIEENYEVARTSELHGRIYVPRRD